MTTFQRGRMPERRVDLRKMLKLRRPTAATLIKALHRAGGAPMEKLDADPGQPRRGGGDAVVMSRFIEREVAPVRDDRLPTHDDGSPLAQRVVDRLQDEAVATSIKGVHAAGGVRLTPTGEGRKA